ncbi:MAG: hypothetical protein K2Q01_04365, partial [Rickettsiales bacterium]|nr:hypothetical protein [Rickettsiales bacterium]
ILVFMPNYQVDSQEKRAAQRNARQHLRQVPALAGDEENFEAETLATLARMYPHFNRAQLKAFRVSRVKYILPLPTAKLQQHPLPFTTSHPGIIVASTAHITDGVLTVNKVMALADAALPHLVRGQ